MASKNYSFYGYLIFTISLLLLFSGITINSVAPILVYRHLLSIVFAVVCSFVAYKINWLNWLKISPLLYWINICLLFFLLQFGNAVRGSTSWIGLVFGFRFQPSQSVLLFSLLYGCRLIADNNKTFNLKKIAFLFLVMFLPAVLIFLQSDFGMTTIYLSVVVGFWFFSNLPIPYFRWLMVAIFSGSIFVWQFFLQPYQKARILSFFGDNQLITESNYQARQSLIAVGSGRLFGKGVGQGQQSQLKFLPERQTDFIFASFAEEWGLLGVLLLIFAYFLLSFYTSFQAINLNNLVGRIFVLSFLNTFIMQIFINIAMNMGIMPITGISLPLMSYGGSSLLINLIAFSIILRLFADHVEYKFIIYRIQ